MTSLQDIKIKIDKSKLIYEWDYPHTWLKKDGHLKKISKKEVLKFQKKNRKLRNLYIDFCQKWLREEIENIDKPDIKFDKNNNCLLHHMCNVRYQDIKLLSKNEIVKFIEILLKKNYSINLTNNKGWTSLMSASVNGNIKIVKLLLEKYNADPNIFLKYKYNYNCCYIGHFKVNMCVLTLLLDEISENIRKKKFIESIIKIIKEIVKYNVGHRCHYLIEYNKYFSRKEKYRTYYNPDSDILHNYSKLNDIFLDKYELYQKYVIIQKYFRRYSVIQKIKLTQAHKKLNFLKLELDNDIIVCILKLLK